MTAFGQSSLCGLFVFAFVFSYEYLLGMKIWSLTFERAEQLRKELEAKKAAVAELENTSPETIWGNDLDAIEELLTDRDAAMAAELEDEVKATKKAGKARSKKNAAAAKNKGKKKKKAGAVSFKSRFLSLFRRTLCPPNVLIPLLTPRNA